MDPVDPSIGHFEARLRYFDYADDNLRYFEGSYGFKEISLNLTSCNEQNFKYSNWSEHLSEQIEFMKCIND